MLMVAAGVTCTPFFFHTPSVGKGLPEQKAVSVAEVPMFVSTKERSLEAWVSLSEIVHSVNVDK